MKTAYSPGDIVYYFGVLYRVLGYGLEQVAAIPWASEFQRLEAEAQQRRTA